MEVQFTPEQEAQLAQIATNSGTDVERLVKDAALRLLQGDGGFRAPVPGSVVAALRALRAQIKPDPMVGQSATMSATEVDRCRWS